MSADSTVVELADVYLYANGNVMAFDQAGTQAIDHQGRCGEVLGRVLAASTPATRFFLADWQTKQAVAISYFEFGLLSMARGHGRRRGVEDAETKS